MLSSPMADKENVLEEIFAITPSRRPLKTVQNGNIVGDGTPLAITKRTPNPRSTRASTPSSRRLARRLKRQSVPFALSKPVSIFTDDTKGIFGGRAGFEENLQPKRNGQELNEVIKDKVSETVVKMKERYEATLAEKQRDLDDKNNVIEKLQSEVNVLRQAQNDLPHPQKCDEDQKDISMFVAEVISNAVREIEREESAENDSFPTSVNTIFQSTSPVRHADTCTTMTPIKFTTSKTSPMKVELTEKETSMTPLVKIHNTTSMTPVQTADANLGTSPVSTKDAVTSTSLHGTDATINTSPICLKNFEISIKLAEHALYTASKSENDIEAYSETEIGASPIQDANNTYLFTKTEGTVTTGGTEQDLDTPTKSDANINEFDFSGVEKFLTPIQEEYDSHELSLTYITERNEVSVSEGNTICASIKSSSVDTGTSMTPIELVDKHTLVSPMKTANVSITTSPLVAALQPEIISSLPLNRLRAELESAAISNELLRSECDDLNAKLEGLQSSLVKLRSEADKQNSSMQCEIDNLQNKLEEALEINYQMEMKKPLNVEEYDETISRLQKDILLKEKQIAFHIKKASEADNLQQDLRRMYAKYNSEHQLYAKMEEERKGITEKYNAKCADYDSLETELSRVKEALKDAQDIIDVQESVRKEAKESQVKCCALEEQIETFQSQQRENLEFLEQERKGLEESTFELEQLVKTRTDELEATRQALEEKTRNCEDTKETVNELRSQLSDVQDELNAVQSQAYLVMLEQEKELTAVSRILEETWERLVTLVDAYKEQLRVQKEPTIEVDSEEISKDTYKPSFVYSVLAAVSGTVPQSDNVEESQADQEDTEATESAEENLGETEESDKDKGDVSDDFTLVSRAKAFQDLLIELERYFQDGHEHAQMTIQRQVDEIANLGESLSDIRQEYEEQIKKLKEELESEEHQIKNIQRENDHKQYEIESLKLELKTVEENFETSREHMKELGNRCCALIEQETENQVLNEKLRLINQELEKVKQDKICLEKELSETVDKLQRFVEASEGDCKETQKIIIEETLTELLNKKLCLEREVEKLRSSFAKTLKENETFAQYYARLENKASVLSSNLIRAEEEIYRLDNIVDRFCTATRNSWQTMTISQDLRDLLKELDISIE